MGTFKNRVQQSSVLSNPHWFFFGMWPACTSWYWLINQVSPLAEGSVLELFGWQAIFAVQAVASLVMALCFVRKPFSAEPDKRFDVVATVLMMTAILCAVLPVPGLGAQGRFVVAMVCGGVFVSWEYLRWSVALGWTSAFNIIAVLFVNDAIAPFAKTMLQILPDYAAMAIVLFFPALNFTAVRRVTADFHSGLRPNPAAPSAAVDKGFLARLAVSIIVFSFVGSALIALFGIGGDAGVGDYVIWQGSEAILAVFILFWVFVHGAGFRFSSIWKFVLARLAAVSVFCVLGIESPVSRLAAFGFIDGIWTLIWAVLIDYARTRREHPAVIPGIGRSLYTLFFFLGAFTMRTAGVTELTPSLLLCFLVAIMVALVLCLDAKTPGMEAVFSELVRVDAPVEEHASLDGRCVELGRARGLSDREVEIIALVAKGRSGTYVAEALCISPNTVKSHMRRIYEKLDIHSKQELMSLLGVD